MDISTHKTNHDLLQEELQAFLDITSAFTSNVNRAHRLIIFATRADFGQASPLEIKTFIEDIMRSCVVITHSSLETALRGVIARGLKVKAETDVPDVPLVGLRRNEKFSWGNLYKHRHKTVEEIIEESIDAYLSRESFNSSDEISTHLKYLGVDLQYVRPLFSDLDAMIQRRHKIVHEADYTRTSKDKQLEMLTHNTVLQWTKNTSRFLWHCVYSIIISERYVKSINRRLSRENRPKFEVTEEIIKNLFNNDGFREQ